MVSIRLRNESSFDAKYFAVLCALGNYVIPNTCTFHFIFLRSLGIMTITEGLGSRKYL